MSGLANFYEFDNSEAHSQLTTDYSQMCILLNCSTYERSREEGKNEKYESAQTLIDSAIGENFAHSFYY